MRKRYLITGGAGFIGTYLCEKLLDQGHHVICLDNFYTGLRSNIIPLLGNKNFELLEQDVTQPVNIEADYIFNLACPASPCHYQAQPVETTKTAILGALNSLEAAKNKKNTRILQASTSEVYGDPREHPQKEDYWGYVNPIGIRACYDEGKRCAETLFFDYYREYATDIRVARIYNTYGPRMRPDDGRVVSNFICAALKNEPITVYGDGLQTRSFCYVDDMVEGLLGLMNAEIEAQPVNLGNPDERTVLDLAHLVIKLTNSSSFIEHQGLPLDDPIKRQPDITRAKTLLNWEPKTSLEDGLMKTIEHFDALLSANKTSVLRGLAS
jgi:UDP-glucuronate decarboxylase